MALRDLPEACRLLERLIGKNGRFVNSGSLFKPCSGCLNRWEKNSLKCLLVGNILATLWTLDDFLCAEKKALGLDQITSGNIL